MYFLYQSTYYHAVIVYLLVCKFLEERDCVFFAHQCVQYLAQSLAHKSLKRHPKPAPGEYVIEVEESSFYQL